MVTHRTIDAVISFTIMLLVFAFASIADARAMRVPSVQAVVGNSSLPFPDDHGTTRICARP